MSRIGEVLLALALALVGVDVAEAQPARLRPDALALTWGAPSAASAPTAGS